MSAAPVSLPAIADEHGPTDRITLDDEFEFHTWLESFLVRSGKAHFLYLAQTKSPRQHYVRYDLKSAKRELDIQPEFRGGQLAIRSLDGFFATRGKEPKSTIYAISHDANASRLACLASNDDGNSWNDFAVSRTLTSAYSIGGCREVTRNGYVIGSFTEQMPVTNIVSATSKVYFFKIRTENAKGQRD